MSQLKGPFRITHPFHPRRDEELERLAYRRGFGYEVVDGCDASGAVVTVPLGFTDAAAKEDPFLLISAGRALFRAGDLIRLAESVRKYLLAPRWRRSAAPGPGGRGASARGTPGNDAQAQGS